MKKVETDVDSVDAAATDYIIEDDHKDQYTIMLDAPLKLSEFTVQPVFLLYGYS